MHQNERFQVWIFKNFLGRGSPSPLPRPLPRYVSGFALGSGFALDSRALRALVCPPEIHPTEWKICAPQWDSLDPPLVWRRHGGRTVTSRAGTSDRRPGVRYSSRLGCGSELDPASMQHLSSGNVWWYVTGVADRSRCQLHCWRDSRVSCGCRSGHRGLDHSLCLNRFGITRLFHAFVYICAQDMGGAAFMKPLNWDAIVWEFFCT